jgi:heptosyltransferase-2
VGTCKAYRVRKTFRPQDLSPSPDVSVTLPNSLANPRPRREDFRRTGNYLVASLSERLRDPLRWYSRRRSRGNPTPPHEWKKGVIIGPSHIGDVLYNTASLPALRAGLPDCQWTYLTSGPSAQVLQGNPHLHEVISLDGPENFSDWLSRARARLTGEHFDAAIAYAVGISWKDLSLATALGIPNRVGYVHKGFSGLVTHPIALHFPQPFPAYFRDLVGQLTGATNEPAASLRPLVYTQREHEEAVDKISAQIGLDWNKQPVLACGVTSRQTSGMWPREKFLESVLRARAQEPCTVVYFGARSDAAELQRLAEKTGPDAFVLAGDLDLLPMVAFLRRCRVALTTDSGPRHLANAAGIPVVFIRNLLNRKVETGGYCETEIDLAPGDLQLLTPSEQTAAFAQIQPETVGAEVAKRLRGNRIT